MNRPPERIETDVAGVFLCRHRLEDVDRLHAAIEASRDHLRPFMPWADQGRDDTAAFVTRARSEWESGESFSYSITGPDGILGGRGLMCRIGPGAIEIGYWLRPDATGRGVATASAKALTAAAFDLDGLDRVEIHCDKANTASAAIPRRLGFTLLREEDGRISAPGDCGRDLIWALARPDGP